METAESKTITKHRHSFVQGTSKVAVLLLLAWQDILKRHEFFKILSVKKVQKQLSHGAQIKKATLRKKVEINEETDNIVSETIVDLIITATQSKVYGNANPAFLNTLDKVPKKMRKKVEQSNNFLMWFRSYVHWAKYCLI